MFLVKNKLKKIKKPIDDDDMLNYLKYAHINHNKSLDRNDLEFDMMIKTHDKSTQTDNKEMEDKQIGVGEDELTDEFVKSYILDMKSNNFSSKEPSRLEKQTQANAIPVAKSIPKSPPTSDDNDDGEGFIGRNTRRGFRLAQLAYYASMAGINVADAVIDMITSAPHHSSDEEVAQPNTQQEVISVHSSPAISVHSSPPISVHSSSVDTVPLPTSPQSSRASSAKTTPRKTSK